MKGRRRNAGAGLFFLSIKCFTSDAYYKADGVPCHGETVRNDVGRFQIGLNNTRLRGMGGGGGLENTRGGKKWLHL